VIHLLIRHKVSNFDQWKANFDQAFAIRANAGERTYHIFRNIQDSNEVTLLCEWESLEKAKQFASSDTLWQGMHKGGVSTDVEIHVLEEHKPMRKTAAD
jgi:heme-degrading monooxygenase HmoA